MLNNLEATIQKLISEAAASMANQIAHSVRQSLASEIMGRGTASTAAAAPAGMAMPKRRGRPPGTKNKPAAAAPAEKAGKKTRKSFKRRIITAAELDAVMEVLGKKPGIGSVQIQKEAGIGAAAVRGR